MNDPKDIAFEQQCAAADREEQRDHADHVVLTDRRVLALVEAVFSADANKGAGFDTLASADWDAVLDHARSLTPRGWDPRWREKCHIQVDHADADAEGDIEWWSVHSPDHQHYLDENDLKWKPCPQMMAGWFMSRRGAELALNKAGLPPGTW